MSDAPPDVEAGAAALDLRGLAKRYRSVEALRGVDLRIEPGELVGLLGPNGAGKSTLVKSVCGLVRPTRGDALVFGARAGTREARSRIGYLAELFRFPDWLRGDELLALHQRFVRSPGGPPERAELLELVGLADAASRRVGEYSKGMQQRLGIAQALVGNPSLLLLDEPTSALDPAGRRTVRELLESLRERGTAVVLNSHLLGEVERVCDRVAIMRAGEIVRAGPTRELAEARGVDVETHDGVRHFDVGREAVPDVVAQLVRDGVRIYDVRVRRTTLEQAYLAAMGEQPAHDAAHVEDGGGE